MFKKKIIIVKVLYEILIDSFVDLIKDGTGFDIRNNKHITLKGDGLEIVNDLINPNRPDINAAIMYNGDAIDSYYGSDNFLIKLKMAKLEQ
ncbi:hypothetical protein NW733_05365 [Mycoplasmopsis felis]|uniref:hypothetical protein n=1 Tax=Mycoplasmopsis felis TaxID=33923 RepID=UPI0021E07593|nr:hypothetical protein [Mycoplasmopsis felis]MCU9932060.1 hypothetical protein [Mycoplasmopsis felis]